MKTAAAIFLQNFSLSPHSSSSTSAAFSSLRHTAHHHHSLPFSYASPSQPVSQHPPTVAQASFQVGWSVRSTGSVAKGGKNAMECGGRMEWRKEGIKARGEGGKRMFRNFKRHPEHPIRGTDSVPQHTRVLQSPYSFSSNFDRSLPFNLYPIFLIQPS